MKTPKIDLQLNLEVDARNYYDAANSTKRWGHDFSKAVKPEIVKKVRGKSFQEVKKYLVDTLDKGYFKDIKRVKLKLKIIKHDWSKIEKEYFKRLAKITKNPIYTNKFRVYTTTIGRCPYFLKDNGFMINIFCSDGVNNTMAHELMHLQFHYYYEDYLREIISKEDFHHIKEALTVLLNIEFQDLLKYKDKGYPNHKKLREFILEQWKETKDLDLVVERCISNLKELV